MYNIQIQSCALVFLTLFAIEFFVRKRENGRQTQAFSCVIVSALLLTIDDIFCPIALTTVGCPDLLRLITGKLYLIFMYWSLCSLLAFTVALTMPEDDISSYKYYLYKVCPFLAALFSVISLFLPLYYVSEEVYVYLYGPCQTVCYIFGAFLAAFFVFYMLANRKKVPIRQQLPVYLYVVIEAIICIIEKLEPTLLLTSFGLVVDIALIYFTFQNPRVIELKNQNSRIEATYNKVFRALVSAVDAKDYYTRGHSKRVAEYSAEIAKRMGKSEPDQNAIYMAGLIHDIGKIRVPESIINKRGSLTEEEYSVIKVHPIAGCHILQQIFDDKRIVLGAKYHHERYDGTGYPNGLAGNDIPEVARIVAAADAYDAMTSNRSYRGMLHQAVAREEMRKGKGTQFDPAIADIVIGMIDQDKNFELCEPKPKMKRILVVAKRLEDAEPIEQLFREDIDYEVLRARTKEEVDKLLTYCEIDLIVLDLDDEGSVAMFVAIRKKYDTVTIILSENSGTGIIEATAKLGNVDFITKPYIPVVLRESVHSIIKEEDDRLLQSEGR